MNRKVMLIVNPKAGKGSIKNALFTICNQLTLTQDFVSVFITQYKQHAKFLTQQHAESFDLLICIGGDGTWNEVVSGIMQIQCKPVLSYLPSGTVNDFAASLGLNKDVNKMMKRIQTNIPFHCDIGSLNDHYFTYVAAFGIFTDISYSTPQQAKNTFGRVAYFLEGIKQLTKIPHFHLKVTIDHQSIEDEFIFGSITNAKYVGGFKSISTKYAELDDGLFEILLIKRPHNPLDVQNIIAALLKREVNEHWMYFARASSLEIESKVGIPWTLDGEDGGEIKQASIINNNKAVTILV